jgi:hypothetical protein
MLRAYRPLVAALLMALALTGCSLSTSPTEETLPVISGPPQVRIAAPLPNASYLEGVGVNVQIAVSNAGTDIDRVEVSLDGVVAATLPDPNPSDAASFGVTQTFTAEGVGAHIVEVRVFRADGTTSEPVSVTYNVVEDLPTSVPPTPTNTVAPTQEASPTATNTVAPTTAAPTTQSAATTQPTTSTGGGVTISTSTPSTSATSQPAPTTASTAAGGTPPRASFEGLVNVRRGPSTNFIPPIGTFNAGDTAEILSLNTNGTWLKVRFAGGEGWVLRELVNTEGDLNALPREAGPPIPTLPPATAVPPTSAVQPTTAPGSTAAPTTSAPTGSGPNLVITGFELRQINGGTPANDISINQPSIAFVRVRNAGNQPAPGFFVVLTIVNVTDGGFLLAEATPVNGLAAGEEILVQVGFTDLAGQGLQKRAVATADQNNQVAESNENDNNSPEIIYTLK